MNEPLEFNPILGVGVGLQNPPGGFWSAAHSIFKLGLPKWGLFLDFHCASDNALFGEKDVLQGAVPGALFGGHVRHFLPVSALDFLKTYLRA